jgi:hypothetical protein
LWEYGRDTFGDRADKSFSEDEWPCSARGEAGIAEIKAEIVRRTNVDRAS